MSETVTTNVYKLRGHVEATQVTKENMEELAKSLNGTIEGGVLTFNVNKRTLRAITGDWIAGFKPFGDVQVYTDAMFNRILEIDPRV